VASKKKSRQHWYKADLHLHTPASSDYQEPQMSYLDILRKAEFRGLDIIAFTDHNTVSGYAAMMAEIDGLSFLERLGRAQPDELRILGEYRRLLD
jgi:histidinol phosphatase-like PHP family hydrolase